MDYFQSNKITKLIFLLIWPFFILRIPTYFKIQENFSQFDITNIKSLILLSMDIALLFIFFFLILIQIIYFFKHRIISKSIILIIYPIIGVIGYHLNGYKNLYQEHILLHHFITLSATFLFFSFIQSNKLFDYKFKELCLKIILSIIFIYFLSIILPSLVAKLYLGQDLRFSFVSSVKIFSKEINLKQNINGQTKFIFILFVFVMVLFKKFCSNKKIVSYLFFLIGLMLISLVYLTQSRLNILASFIFSIFIIISIKDLTLKNKLTFLILIFAIPFLVFNFNETMPNRFIEQHRVILPQDIVEKNKLVFKIDNQKESIFLEIDKKKQSIFLETDKKKQSIFLETDKKKQSIFLDTENVDGKINTWYESKNFNSKADVMDGKADIMDGKADIMDGKADVMDGKADVMDGKADVMDGKADVMDGKAIPDNFSPINIKDELNVKEMQFNLEILFLELLNEDNEINYDIYVAQHNYINEFNRKKKTESIYDFPNSYPATLKNIVGYNYIIVLGKCLETLILLDSILSGRLCGWQILYDIIEKREFIFGKGFFADQVYLKPVEKVASNSFVNILFNTGLISLLIYIAVILVFFIKYFKFKNLNHTNIYISISHYYFIYFIFRSFFEDTLAFVSIDLLLLGAVSILIKHNSQHANN